MSGSTRDALRRARLRELMGPADGAPKAEGRAELHEYDAGTETVQPTRRRGHVMELTEGQLDELEQLAERFEYASVLDRGLSGSAISEAAAWNAREALENDVGRSWPSTIPGATPGLQRKIHALFTEVT